MNHEEKILLTVPEVAETMRVEENTVRTWLSKGKVIPARIITRLGRRVLFQGEKFIEWMNNGCKMDLQGEING